MIRKRFLQSILPLLFLLAVKESYSASLQYGDRCVSGENSTSTDTDLMCNAKESLTCQNGTCLCSDMTSMIYEPSLGLCVGLAGQECVHHPTEAHLPNFRKTHCVAYASCENRTCNCWAAFYLDETGHCSRKRGYLQQCRMDYQCDGRQGFVCKEGLCVCDPNSAAYNPELERCVGLADQPCVNQYRECVENYKCKLGVCSCRYKEIQGADGKLKCDPVTHKYGKVCGRHRGSCGSHLLCINGKCRCPNPDYQVYDYDQRICVSLIGGPCTVLPSSTQTIVLEEGGSAYHILRANKAKRKQWGIQNKASSSSTSSSSSLPSKNKIKKKQTGTGYGNSTVELDPEDGLQKVIPCISYARCLPYQDPQSSDGQPEMGRCECERGYIETKKGKCNLPYNAPCDTHSKNKKDVCDETVPLYCVNNVCGCKNALDVYDDETKGCKKSIGGLCWKDPSCTSSARCIRYSPRLPGRCMCPQNTHPDPNSSTCLLSYDVDAGNGYDEEDDVDDK